MKKRIGDIAAFAGQEVVVRVDRKPLDAHPLEGFVVGISDKLLLLHVVDGSTLLLNGYAVVRLADVRAVREDETFVSRVLRLLDRKPVVPPGIELVDWASVLSSVQERYPLLLIELEKKEPGCGFIGAVAKQTKRSVELRKVNTQGHWAKTENFAFKDITQVEFDDGYVNALARLVEHEATSR